MADVPICPETGRPMRRDVRPLEVSYKGRSKTVQMPGWYSDASDEAIYTKADMKVSDFALVTLKAEAMHLLTPEEVKDIRTRVLHLSQAEAGRIIGGGPRSFQKYESGEVMTSRAMTNLLRALALHPEDIASMKTEAQAAEPATRA